MNDGRTEHGYEAIRKSMRQVMMRITAYADRLLAGLGSLDWLESIKEQQRNWIGKKEGVEIDFRSENGDIVLTVFTRGGNLFNGLFYFIPRVVHLCHCMDDRESALYIFRMLVYVLYLEIGALQPRIHPAVAQKARLDTAFFQRDKEREAASMYHQAEKETDPAKIV